MLVTQGERRAFTRLPVNCRVVLKANEEKREIQGRGLNLSGNGIMFLAPEELAVGTELEVNVLPTLPSLAPLTALVKVVRAERSAQPNEFAVAGKIKQILG